MAKIVIYVPISFPCMVYGIKICYFAEERTRIFCEGVEGESIGDEGYELCPLA
jgi:hypothetical protein